MTPNFDPSALIELFELEDGAPLLVQTLVNDFVTVSGTLVNAIKVAHAKGDFAAAERSAHSLKSSSRVLGLNALADASGEIESQSRDRLPAASSVEKLDNLRLAALAEVIPYVKSRNEIQTT